MLTGYFHYVKGVLSAYPRVGAGVKQDAQKAYNWVTANIDKSESYRIRWEFLPGPKRTSYTTAIESVPAAGGSGDFVIAVLPNPFNPSTVITLKGALQAKNYSLKIFNMQGRLVQDLKSTPSQFAKGVVWNAGSKASGMYLLKATLDGKTYTQRLILMK